MDNIFYPPTPWPPALPTTESFINKVARVFTRARAFVQTLHIATLPFLRKEAVTTTLLALFFSILLTFPTILSIHRAYIGDGWDNYEFSSYMGLAAQALKDGQWPLGHTDFWRYPIGFEVARGFDSYLTVGIGTLLTLLVGLPTSYNLVILLFIAANYLCSYIFFRSLTRSKTLGHIGALIYGLSFYTIAKAGSHPNLLFIGSITLYAYAVLQLLREALPTKKHLWMLAGAIILLALGSTEYLILTVLFSGIYTLIGFFMARDYVTSLYYKLWLARRTALIPALVAVSSLTLLYLPHITGIFSGATTLIDRSNELKLLTPSLLDYLWPNSYLKLLINSFWESPSMRSIERPVFFGWVELVLFVLFLRSNFSKKLKLFLSMCFVVPFVISLGYGNANDFPLLPYRVLQYIFPFSVIVQTGRYILFAYLFTTIAILLLLKNLVAQKKTWLLVVIIGLLVLERIPWSTWQAPLPQNDAYVSVVAKQDSKAVADFPVNIYHRPYNILSLYYKKPIINGYFHFLGDGEKEQAFLTENALDERYTCNGDIGELDFAQEDIMDKNMVANFKSHGITTLVVHKDDKFFHPICTNVRKRLSRFAPFVTTVKETKADIQTKIEATALDGKPSFSLFFPKSGTFSLDGMYIAPREGATFTIVYNNNPVPFQYSWNVNPKDHTMQLTPKYSLSLPVEAGSTLTIYSPFTVSNTEASIWYRYVADPLPITVYRTEPVEKIFEDDKAIVYTLH